jgi:micrococcal nuclease
MANFFEKYSLFFAIIIAGIIIGGFCYVAPETQKTDVRRPSDSKPVELGAPLVSPSVIASQQAKQSQTTDRIASSPEAPRNDGNADAGLVQKCGADENTIVTKLIDGDTVVVEGGYHVRLLGMDADEKGYPCHEAAKNRLEKLVLGKQILLEKDVSDVDQYGRCLRYMFVDGVNVDIELVKEGLAVARFYAPDVKYRTEISEAEEQAQTNGIGCKWTKTQ